MSSTDIKIYADRFEKTFSEFIAGSECPEPLKSAVVYSVSNGGKRLRPALCYLGAEFAGGDLSVADDFALAIELIHSYSLVHDDLPCMDDDSLRRGKPATHAAFGEGMAVLCGDALLNLAFEAMLSGDMTEARTRAARAVAAAAGCSGMIGGQCDDIKGGEKSEKELISLYSRKTSALLKGALVSGAAAAGAGGKVLDDLSDFAEYLGIAYQIRDDLLDVTSSSEILGKNTGSDAENGKYTFVSVSGLHGAEQKAAGYTDAALGVLAGYGARADKLIRLCGALLSREY